MGLTVAVCAGTCRFNQCHRKGKIRFFHILSTFPLHSFGFDEVSWFHGPETPTVSTELL